MAETEGYFETRLSFEPKRDAIWKPIVQYLQRYIPDKARILELGAGYCSFINQVSGQEKHALDISPMVRKHAGEDVKVHIQDCTRLRKFKSNYFDVVFSSFLYEHLTRHELDRVMSELRRILRTGGVLITLLPNYKYISRHYFDDYTHIQVFSHVSFADYLQASGFEIHDVQGRFIPYSFKSRFPKSALLTWLYLRLPFRPFAGNMLVVARNPVNKPMPEHRRDPNPSASGPAPSPSGQEGDIAPVSVLKVSKRPARRPPERSSSRTRNSSDRQPPSESKPQSESNSGRSRPRYRRPQRRNQRPNRPDTPKE